MLKKYLNQDSFYIAFNLIIALAKRKHPLTVLPETSTAELGCESSNKRIILPFHFFALNYNFLPLTKSNRMSAHRKSWEVPNSAKN